MHADNIEWCYTIFERRMVDRRVSRCVQRFINYAINYLSNYRYLFRPLSSGDDKIPGGDDVGDVTREFRVEREKNLKSAYLSACRFRQIARVLACGIKLRQHLLFF